MKLYTKMGDGGETRLFGGQTVSKCHPRVAAYGDLDELNAVLGLAESMSPSAVWRRTIHRIQSDLFVLGADLATPPGARIAKPVPRISPKHVHRLEREIDRLIKYLPPLKNFILPGGSSLGAVLHLARAVARRAERSLVPLLKSDVSLRGAQVFLNRLSDYLFVLARRANADAHSPERVWKN